MNEWGSKWSESQRKFIDTMPFVPSVDYLFGWQQHILIMDAVIIWYFQNKSAPGTRQ